MMTYAVTHHSSSSASAQPSPQAQPVFDQLEPRSFSICAHIDHGKSTLADRILELTGTIPRNASNKQVLDTLKVERERGITVKSQSVSMIYDHPISQRKYLLNLIDTPGHVDFAWEVQRSLAACQVALFVIDATQGVQAQSISVFKVASSLNLHIIPVLNKIDMPAADIERTSDQLRNLLGIDLDRHPPICISAKTGQGVDQVLQAIVDRTDPIDGAQEGATQHRDGPGFRALVFDSWFDHFRGVVALVSIKDGAVRKGDKIASCSTGKRYEVTDLSINHPTALSVPILRKGQVGMIIANMKKIEDAEIGDTFHLAHETVEPLESFESTTPMVFAGIFPVDSTEWPKLEDSLKRLTLNDRSISYARDSSLALGQGARLGFLGTLHLSVFRQRLEDEFGQRIIVTAPSVPYRLTYADGSSKIISNPADFPDESGNSAAGKASRVVSVEEPMVNGVLSCPHEYVGAMMELCAEHRGIQLDTSVSEFNPAAAAAQSSSSSTTTTTTFSSDGSAAPSVMMDMTYRLPLGEIATTFFDSLKSRSKGYASFSYAPDGYAPADIVKLSLLVASARVDALDMCLERSKGQREGREWVKRLKEAVPRQQFEVAIQATVGGKIVARETISAYRKDVTSGLYGGHYERKLKHLNKQKAGKARLKEVGLGRVKVPHDKFVKLLDTRAGER
ncbi:Translation factor guf1 mitochondrial [Tilletia horrida]|uniref:Translation factor guf1 mitochondrial n=1 Tax=Tilletia horrida TaxID=155126 RepID=A0AAN6GK61_9BASI|nr:Translation factor guf1 mitochondrial [Tilletia horrida]